MDRIFLVNEEAKEQILQFSRSDKFPRVAVQVNRRRDGYLITINGIDDEVSKFIEWLKSNGVELNA